MQSRSRLKRFCSKFVVWFIVLFLGYMFMALINGMPLAIALLLIVGRWYWFVIVVGLIALIEREEVYL